MHTKVQKRREKELKRQGIQHQVANSTAEVTKHAIDAANSWNKNKHYKLMYNRVAKSNAREKGPISKRQSTKDTGDPPDMHIQGQSTPSRNQIQRYSTHTSIANTRGADHEKGHALQSGRIYVHGGTKALAKAAEHEIRTTVPVLQKAKKPEDLNNTLYGSSPREHNANHYAEEGDTKKVKKEREDMAKAFAKSTKRSAFNAIEKIRDKNIKDHYKTSKENYGEKNIKTQQKLNTMSRLKESALLDIEFK